MKKAFLILTLFLVASCTEANRKTTIAAIIGGLVGSGVGAIAGHQSDHDGAGVAIGAGAGIAIGALVGQALENQSGPKYADSSITSQDRPYYDINNYASNNNDSLNTSYNQYSYNNNFNTNNNVNPEFKNSSGYFGAINGGTYSEYDANLMNYVNTGEARGYLGALANDPRVANVKNNMYASNDTTGPINKGLYGSQNFTGGSYAGKSYIGGTESNSENNNIGVIPSVVNARNVEYPKASYSFDNPSNDLNVNNNSIIETTVYNNQLDSLNSDDCQKAKDEVLEANKTEVLADKLYYFRRALRLCPDSADYHNGLGEVYLVLNRKDDAIYEFNEALKLNPSLYIAKKNLNMVNNSY